MDTYLYTVLISFAIAISTIVYGLIALTDKWDEINAEHPPVTYDESSDLPFDYPFSK